MQGSTSTFSKWRTSEIRIRGFTRRILKQPPESKGPGPDGCGESALMSPLREAEVTINQKALVVGGAYREWRWQRASPDKGNRVALVERSKRLGGQALHLYKTWKGEDIQENLAGLIKSVDSDPNIEVHLESELSSVEGFVGNFKSSLRSNGKEEVVEHGIAVLATGAQELKPEEYSYGQDRRVLTSLELDQRLREKDHALKAIKTAVFIQCVGSRESERPYCSRVCCTHSVESALQLKELNPDVNVYIMYRT